MTAPSSIDAARFLSEQLQSTSPDLLRSMLTTFINTLMSAEADAICGAPTTRIGGKETKTFTVSVPGSATYVGFAANSAGRTYSDTAASVVC